MRPGIGGMRREDVAVARERVVQDVVEHERPADNDGQPEPRRDIDARSRGEHVHGDPRRRRTRRHLFLVAEEAHELPDLPLEHRGRGPLAPERAADGRREPQRVPDPEVDPVGVEGGEHAELLGDDERLVLRQHDAARAQADPFGHLPDRREQHRGRSGRDAGHGVMLGDPEPAVAELLGALRTSDRIMERLPIGVPGAGPRTIEKGELHAQPNTPRPGPIPLSSAEAPSTQAWCGAGRAALEGGLTPGR